MQTSSPSPPAGTTGRDVAPVSVSRVSNVDTISVLAHSVGVDGALIIVGLLLFHLLWSLDAFAGVLRPRTVVADDRRRPPIPQRRWLRDIIWLGGDDLIDTVGLDAYFYLRYQRLAIVYFGLMAAVCCPILIPYHMAGRAASGSPSSPSADPNRPIVAFHFSELTLGNVPSGDRGLWLHVACAYVQAAVLVALLIREAGRYVAASARHHLASTLTVQVGPLPVDIQKDSAWRRLVRRLAGSDEVRAAYVLRTPNGSPTPVAFATMASVSGAARLLAALNARRAGRLRAERAPLPGDVIWENLALAPGPVLARRLASGAVVVGMIVFWTVPLTAIASMGDWLDDWPALQGVLPSWAFLLLLTATPPILGRLSAQERRASYTARHRSVFGNFTWVLVLDFFLFGAVSRGLVRTLWRAAERPLFLTDLLAKTVPEQSTIMIIYLLSFTCLTLPYLDLNRILASIVHVARRCPLPDALPLFPYGEYYSYQVLHLLMGYTYATLAPLMLPFVVLYFVTAAGVAKVQFCYVYGRREGGGMLFPAVLSRSLHCAMAACAIHISVLLSKQGTAPALTLAPILAVLAVAEVHLRRMCRSAAARPGVVDAEDGAGPGPEAYRPPWMRTTKAAAAPSVAEPDAWR